MNKLVVWLLAVFWSLNFTLWGQIGIFYRKSLTLEQQEFMQIAKSLLVDSTLSISDALICIYPGFGSDSPLSVLPTMDKQLRAFGYTILYYRTPLYEVWDRQRDCREIDPRITPHRGMESVPRYCLVLSQDSLGVWLWLQDYLAAQPWRWSYRLDGDTSGCLTALAKELRQEVPLVDFSLVETVEPEYMVSLSGEPLDSLTQAALERLSVDGWKLELNYGNYGGLGFNHKKCFKPEEMAKLGKLLLARFVCLTISRPLSSLRSAGHSLPPLDLRDAYGNRVWRDDSREAEDFEQVTFYSPLPLLDSTRNVELSFDLQPLGYQFSLKNMFVCRGLPRLAWAESWPYRVYANPEVLARVRTADVNEFLAGLADMETQFNFARGEVVKNVYITSDDFINAGLLWGDTASVYLHQGTVGLDSFAIRQGVNARIIGRHEAIHALIRRLNLNKSIELVDLFNRFRGLPTSAFFDLVEGNSFLAQLDEARFDPDAGMFGGHSYSSVHEFMASYLNSIIREGWEEIILQKEAEFRLQYAMATQIVRNVFQQRTELRQTALCRLLESRLDWLKKIK